MRRSLVIAGLLLSFLSLAPAQSTYSGLKVRITQTFINKNEMLVIYAVDNDWRAFTFACNPDETFCSSPEVGSIYTILSNEHRYHGENYTLSVSSRTKGPDRIDVFLSEAIQ